MKFGPKSNKTIDTPDEQQASTRQMLKPYRGAEETFEQYKERRSIGNKAVRQYLKGR